jgi:hypothetical protein
MIFTGISKSRDINPQTEADQGVECRWVTREELETMKETDTRLRPENYRYAKAALERVVRD